MTPDIDHAQITTEIDAKTPAWTTPEIASFDAVVVTESTGALPGDFLVSLS
jgi:hypothetical protein